MQEPTILGAVLLLLGAIYIAFFLFKRLRKEEIPRTIPHTIGQLLAVSMIVVIVAAFITPISPIFWQPAVEPAVGPTLPTEIVTPEKKGYVIATVQDEYKSPTTMIDNAEIYISLDQPVVGTWTPIATSSTGTTGSVQVTVPGVISGSVYVTSGKSGYYPAYGVTTIPGAEVVASSLAANLKLPKIGSLSWTLTDNSNAYMEGTETIVENVTASTSAYFTLRIYTDNAYMALQNLRMLLVRGDAWSTLGASMAPVVLDSAGTSVTTSGDVTLTVEVSGQFSFVGDLTYGQMIEIKVTTSVTSAASGTMAKLYIDDLLGTKDILGGTGISEKVITIKTVT